MSNPQLSRHPVERFAALGILNHLVEQRLQENPKTEENFGLRLGFIALFESLGPLLNEDAKLSMNQAKALLHTISVMVDTKTGPDYPCSNMEALTLATYINSCR